MRHRGRSKSCQFGTSHSRYSGEAFGKEIDCRDVAVGQLLNVELAHPNHLDWPDFDVDLAVESIEHPEQFALVSRKRLKHSAAAEAGQKRRRGWALLRSARLRRGEWRR